MTILEILTPILIGFFTAIACLFPYFKNENKRLNNENEKQKDLISKINDVKKIQNNNSKLSKSDIIDQL